MKIAEAKIQKAVEEEVHSIFDADMKNTKQQVTDLARNERRQARAKKNPKDSGTDDENLILHVIEDAEKATVQAIESAEKATLAAVQSDLQRRTEVTEHTNQALTESVQKVKAAVHDYLEKRQTHFWPKDAIEQHEDRALLHALEAVEKAVLHGVQEEVNNLFLFQNKHEAKARPSNERKKNEPKKDR